MKKKTVIKRAKFKKIDIEKIILPVLNDSSYKYNPKEVSGMCNNVKENLNKSSRKALETLNSIVILK